MEKDNRNSRYYMMVFNSKSKCELQELRNFISQITLEDAVAIMTLKSGPNGSLQLPDPFTSEGDCHGISLVQ